MSENRVQRRIFGPKGQEVVEAGEGCIMKSFITCKVKVKLSPCLTKYHTLTYPLLN